MIRTVDDLEDLSLTPTLQVRNCKDLSLCSVSNRNASDRETAVRKFRTTDNPASLRGNRYHAVFP